MQSLFKYSLCSFILLFLGCGDVISVKKYNPSFALDGPFTLQVDETLDYNAITQLFLQHTLTITHQSTLHIILSSNPITTQCPLSASSIAKENFVRISVLQNNEEMYRIQRNQKGEIALEDIERLIVKLKKDLEK